MNIQSQLAAKDAEIEEQKIRADEAIRQSQGYLQCARDCLDRLAAKDAEIAGLQSELRLAISARDYANDMLDKARSTESFAEQQQAINDEPR